MQDFTSFLRFFFGLDKILKLSLHDFFFFFIFKKFGKVALVWKKEKKKIIFLMFLDVLMGLPTMLSI